MNTTQSGNTEQFGTTDPTFSPHDARIDAVLHAYARAVPAPGLESRVAGRIAAASRHPMRSGISLRILILRRFSVGALAAAAAYGVVIASVEHSQRGVLPLAASPIRSGGLGTAGRVYVPTKPMPERPQIDPASPRTPPHGRAVVSRNHGRRPSGAAVPRSPYPPDDSQ
jgi:hypothetical protein